MLSSSPLRFRGRQLCAIPAVVICLTLLYFFLSTDDLYTKSSPKAVESKDKTPLKSQSTAVKPKVDQVSIYTTPTVHEQLEQSRPSKLWNYEEEKEEPSSKDTLVHSQPSKSWDYEKEDPKPLLEHMIESTKPLELSDDDQSSSDSNTTEYIALCLAIKDQPLDLVEWLVHHYQHVGVSRFYIMDDGSNPPLSEVELPVSIPRSAVTFQYFNATSRVKWMQLHVYNQCVKLHGNKHKWMGFIDADEFIQVKGGDTLKTMLHELDKNRTVGALAMNWEIHTSGGLLTRPYSARKSFTTCVLDPDPNHNITTGTDSEHIKSIVKTEFFSRSDNPHKMFLKNGTITVGENGDKVDGKAWRFPVTRERISLHHYSVKSKAEFEEKMNRSNGMNDPKGWGQWEKIHNMPSRPCNDMVVYDP